MKLSKRDVLLLLMLFAASFLPLTTHEGRESFAVETPDGWNTVTVDGHTIAVTDADCHDKICVKTGAISQKGEVIACLPHKLIIEIK